MTRLELDDFAGRVDRRRTGRWFSGVIAQSRVQTTDVDGILDWAFNNGMTRSQYHGPWKELWMRTVGSGTGCLLNDGGPVDAGLSC